MGTIWRTTSDVPGRSRQVGVHMLSVYCFSILLSRAKPPSCWRLEVALQPRRLSDRLLFRRRDRAAVVKVSWTLFLTHHRCRRRTSARPGRLLGAGLSRGGAAPLGADEAKSLPNRGSEHGPRPTILYSKAPLNQKIMWKTRTSPGVPCSCLV